MKRKKITALFAVLAMTASLVTGCGTSAGKKGTSDRVVGLL